MAITFRICTLAISVLLMSGCEKKATLPIPPVPQTQHECAQTATPFSDRRLDDAGLKAFMESGSPPKQWPLRQWNSEQLEMAALYYNPGFCHMRSDWSNGNHAVFSGHLEKWLTDILIDYYSAERHIALYHSQENIQKPILDIFEQRSAAGQGLNLNASQILMAYQQTRLAEKDAEGARDEAQEKLAAFVGVPTAAVTSIAINWRNMNNAANIRDIAFDPVGGDVPTAYDRQIALAQTHYNAALSKLRTSDELLASLQSKSKHLSDQLGSGDVARLPALLAQSEIATASLARLDAQVQWLKARAELDYANRPASGESSAL